MRTLFARPTHPLLLALLIGSLALLTVAPAQAAPIRVLQGPFGSAAQPTFVQPEGMAVDYGNGDLYVIDVGANTVSRFKPNGEADPFSSLGTNVIDGKRAGAVNECPAVPADCDETPANGLVFPTNPNTSPREVQVAIDESGGPTDGDIYVTQGDQQLIYAFAADGHYLGSLSKFKAGPAAEGSEQGFGPACGVAVDSSGALYVGDRANNLIHKYVLQAPSHNPLNTADNVANFAGLNEPCTMAAGASPSAGSLFVLSWVAEKVFKLDSATGAKASPIPIASEDRTTVSVFPASGHVFVGKGLLAAAEVREFDASGAQPVEVSAAATGATARGFAQSKEGNRLYVARAGDTRLQIYSEPLAPPIVTTDPASAIGPDSATVNGSIDPEGGGLEACQFQYVSDAEYEQKIAEQEANSEPLEPFAAATTQACAETPAQIGSGTDPVAVHADLSGLQPTEYHFRLRAISALGTFSAQERTFAVIAAPTIEDEHAESVTEAEALIRARINPNFFATTYHVQYGPTAAYGQSTLEAPVGSDGAFHPIAAPLTGLTPGTTYHWQILATSANGEVAESTDHAFATYRAIPADTNCPNQALRAAASAALPDCRAYEMVSPVDKNGDSILSEENPRHRHDAYIQATPEGDKITYSAHPSFGDQPSNLAYNQYLASRGAGGWSNHGINPPRSTQLPNLEYFEREGGAFSEDLCSSFFADYNVTPLTAEGQPGAANLYRRRNCAPGTDSFEALTTAPAPPGELAKRYVNTDSVGGFSDDLSRVFFIARGPLQAANATPVSEDFQVYLHLAGDPDLRFVSILPDGTLDIPGPGQDGIGNSEGGNLHNAVSADGRRVFWAAKFVNGKGKVYLRENPEAPETTAKDGEGNCVPDPALACTIEVSEGNEAVFWDAADDGSAAIYSEGSLSSGTATLYGLAVASQTRTVVAEDVRGVLGASEDLSRIYLASDRALTPGQQNSEGDEAVEGQPNVYLDEEGELTFVATLANGDTGGLVSVSSQSPGGRATRVTPDGSHLAFESRAPLTGFDNTDANNGQADLEVFTYEAGGGLSCVSCNPAGVRPSGGELMPPYVYPRTVHNNPFLKTNVWAAAWIPTWEHPLHASNVLSTDGNRLFFHSYDALLPRDTNGAQDVYEWEAPGTGGCNSSDPDYFAQNDGCLYLISSGESPEESEFWEASADGRDVFFTTSSSLLPQDPGLVDLYDVRVEGGFPQPVTPAACEGEACQGPPSPPNDPTPASSAFQGAGNVVAGSPHGRRCPKGRRSVRSHGKQRCVKRQRVRSNRKHRRANHDRRAAR